MYIQDYIIKLLQESDVLGEIETEIQAIIENTTNTNSEDYLLTWVVMQQLNWQL